MATPLYHYPLSGDYNDALGFVGPITRENFCAEPRREQDMFSFVTDWQPSGNTQSLKIYNPGAYGCPDPTALKRRAEMKAAIAAPLANANGEHWYGWSNMVMADEWLQTDKGVITMQLQGGGAGPEFYITLGGGNTWQIKRSYLYEGMSDKIESIHREIPVTKGVRNNWVVHRKRVVGNTTDGLTEVWHWLEGGTPVLLFSTNVVWSMDYALKGQVGNISYKVGCYWGSESRPDVGMRVAHMRCAEGADGFNDVDPTQDDGGSPDPSVDPVPPVPAGFTALNLTTLPGYTDTSTNAAWASTMDSDAYPEEGL